MDKEEKKQFWQTEVPSNVRQYVYLGGGAACVTGAMTVIFALVISPYMWLDAILTISLALGILIGKSRACAVIMLVYFTISKLMQLGALPIDSIVVAIAFIIMYACGAIGTFRYHNLLAAYEKEQAAAAEASIMAADADSADEAAFDEEAEALTDEDDIYYDEKD